MDNAILSALFAFAVEYSGLADNGKRPIIELKSANAVCKKAAPFANCPLLIRTDNNPVAVYDWNTNKIWLIHGANTNNVVDRSYIVHEYVHFLQDQYGEFNFDCPSSHERDAYFVQGLYFRSQGVKIPRGIFSMLKQVSKSCNVEW